ncbi:translocation/assembly module TamB [Polaribacter sp. HL-MS24]|uniref:translocation/assembly module TamB domain-containing protein n=1 Tax=Polaribacter sp. HL-MS24 TaxID=3077735 RepID=UPI002934ED5D|nr:translocation/assembly module TamB [Polaribacter sp. HL-MS24]WOC39823.1 translocation/assembly module TamB [Polaribacter sp. HL-MS24]
MATHKINTEYGTDLLIKKVDLSFLGSVQLRGIEIRDHHKDTLIFVNRLSTSLLNAKKILDGDVKLKNIRLEDAHFYMKTYKNEQEDNLTIFIDRFGESSKDSLKPPFVLETSKIAVSNLNYQLINENDQQKIKYQAFNISGVLQDFSIVGPEVKSEIRGLSFIDSSGLGITSFSTDFEYTLSAMHFQNTSLKTLNSSIDGDVLFTYKRADLADFNNKVKVKAAFRKSTFSIRDFKKLYSELSGNDLLIFTANASGTLNNLKIQNLELTSKKGVEIFGDLSFKHFVNFDSGFTFKADLSKLSATYSDLKSILPNILGNTMPSEFSRFGRFSLNGLIKVTPEQVNANVKIASDIGSVVSNLTIANIDNIDFATYKGDIGLVNFDIGAFFNNPLFHQLSLKGAVNGSGFKLENINTSFKGVVSKFDFKDYAYHHINANGQYQNNKFDGELSVDDENLKMNFKGLADLSSAIHKFDFDADISLLNLQKTNLFTRDSIALLKGKIVIDVEGNSFENIVGNAFFKDVFYTNQEEEFTFKEFKVSSSVIEDIKRIEVESKDIANGYLSGKFTFSELLPVAQNALGSIYTNYQPYQVAENQFIDFNFTVYNQIVHVFFPEIYIDDQTKIKGKIVADKNQLKLNITSPRIEAYGNEVKDVRLLTDNQNTLYNTSLTASKLNTKYYSLSKLNLLNRTENDTLYFKSVFDGGKLSKEAFNVDFYYTINPEGKSVLAFQESTFNIKDNVWKIHPNKTFTDKIIFDLKAGEFDFSEFQINSEEQQITFTGSLKGNTEKALRADFSQVKLESFLPQIDSLDLKGVFSGNVDFLQQKGVYSPVASILIQDFEINNVLQGDLALNIIGDNSYEKYNVDLSLNSEKVKSIAASGSLDFSSTRPLIELNVFLEDFHLNAFSPLGKDVLSSLRGTASGAIKVTGFLGNPDMQGILRLKKAGMLFPYLNVDYNFDGESVVILDGQSFFFDKINLLDKKFNTKGVLDGRISHLNFELWELELNIDTDNLLILDTQNTDDALYYGTGFFKGSTSITGLTDQLTIDVNGSTQ